MQTYTIDEIKAPDTGASGTDVASAQAGVFRVQGLGGKEFLPHPAELGVQGHGHQLGAISFALVQCGEHR